MRANEFIIERRDAMFQFVKSVLPKWPDYVLKDWIYNLARGNHQAGPGSWEEDPEWGFNRRTILKMIADNGLSPDTQWQLVPDMQFTLDMFEPKSKQKLIGRAGGSSDLGMGIPRDKERHATQAALAQQQGGVRKEPVILIKTANGYKLLEGWHRTIQHFHKYPDGYTGPAYVAVAQGQQGVTEGRKSKIIVKPSPGKGNGLFATKLIKAGEVITSSKFEHISDKDWQLIKNTTPVKLYGFKLGDKHALQSGPFKFKFTDQKEKALWDKTEFKGLSLSGFMFVNGADSPDEVNSKERFSNNTAEMIATQDIQPGQEIIKQYNVPTTGVTEGRENDRISFQVQKGKNKFATAMKVNNQQVGVYQYDANTGRSVAEIYPEFKGKGLGKLLVLHAIHTAAQLGLDFQEDESRTSEYDNVLDSLSGNGYIVDDDGRWYVTGEGEQYLQHSLKQGVAEAFDTPLPITWEKGMHGDVDALAKLPDGSNLSIMFNKQDNIKPDDKTWMVEFYRNNSQEVTGEGDAQKVFSTVLVAIQQFIKKYKPLKIYFSASKEIDPSINYGPDDVVPNPESRAKLYDRMVLRYAKSWGYKFFRADNGSSVIYQLSRMKSNVAEAEAATKNSNEIWRQLRAAGYHHVGSGADATVWAKDDSHVIKILMPEDAGSKAEQVFRKFYEFALGHQNLPCVPRFNEVNTVDINGKDYTQIEMERLSPIEKGGFLQGVVWLLSDYAIENKPWSTVERELTDGHPWYFFNPNYSGTFARTWESLLENPASKKTYNMYKQLYTVMQLLYTTGNINKFGWDLHTANVMQRGNGQPVIIDPWFSEGTS